MHCEPSGLSWDHLGAELSLEISHSSVGNGCLCVSYYEANHRCGFLLHFHFFQGICVMRLFQCYWRWFLLFSSVSLLFGWLSVLCSCYYVWFSPTALGLLVPGRCYAVICGKGGHLGLTCRFYLAILVVISIILGRLSDQLYDLQSQCSVSCVLILIFMLHCAYCLFRCDGFTFPF